MAYDHPLVQHVLKDDIYYIMNINEHYIIYNITIYIYVYIAIYHQLILIASNNLRGSKESRQTWPKQKRFRAWSPTPVAPVGSPSLKVSVCRSAVDGFVGGCCCFFSCPKSSNGR